MKILFAGMSRDDFVHYQGVFNQLGIMLKYIHSSDQATKEVQRTMYDAVIIEGASIDEDGDTLVEKLSRFRARSKTLCFGKILGERCESTEMACIAIGAAICIQPDCSASLATKRIRRMIELTLDNETKVDPDDTDASVTYGMVEVFASEAYVLIDGHKVQLTVTESRMIDLLARAKGRIKSRNQLMDVAYPENACVDDRTIDSHIKRLRRKLKDNKGNKVNIIETIYGMGYKLLEKPA